MDTHKPTTAANGETIRKVEQGIGRKSSASPQAMPDGKPLDLFDVVDQLDGIFSEPTTALAAQIAAKEAQETIGEVDPCVPCKRPDQVQAFLSYQQAMRPLIGAYVMRTEMIGPRESLTLAAQRMLDGGRSEHSMAEAYVLATENFESFVELMCRLAKPLRQGTGAQQCTPNPHYEAFGGTPSAQGSEADEGHVTGVGPSPEAGDFARESGGGSAATALGGRPGSRLTNYRAPRSKEPIRKETDRPLQRSHALPSQSVRKAFPEDIRPCSPVLGCSHELLKRKLASGDRSQEQPTRSADSDGADVSMQEESLSRCCREIKEEARLPKFASFWNAPRGEKTSENGTPFDKGDKVDWPTLNRERGAKIGGPALGSRSDVLDSNTRHAQSWFMDLNTQNWISLPVVPEVVSDDASSSKPDRMDMSSTFGTDMAVASPSRPLDGSNSIISSNSFSPGSPKMQHVGHSSVYRGFCMDHDDGDDDGGVGSDRSYGSEEIFPDEDPSDPSNGCLPHLYHHLLDDWPVD